MEEQGERLQHNELPCNNDEGHCVSSSGSENSSVQQVVITDNAVVLTSVQEEQHDQPPNSTVSERRGSRYHHLDEYRWLPRCVFQRVQMRFLSFRSSEVASEAWSCTVVILTFWSFACMILMLGFYGSFDLQLGPNCSYVIGANPLFARSIKAQEVGDQSPGPILYGFYTSPSLDVETTWSTTHNASIDPGFHREWPYYLNAGSRIEIHYDVQFPTFDPLSLVIAQGRESVAQWMVDPSYPNTTLSWNIIYESGSIIQDITDSDLYYVAVGNLNLNAVEVNLNITIQSLLYNTSSADFKCYLHNRACTFKVKLLKPNVAVLATPGPGQVHVDTDFYLEISFGPQWLTYCIGSGIMTVFIIVMFRLCDKYQSDILYDTGNQTTEIAPEREPLISPKSDQSSSMGSSYESHSNDEDDVEEKNTEGGPEGKSTKVGGSNSKNSHLCAICFDAPKDCFFVPCGHSAACFTCASRIAEEAGICPICRRRIKQVRKIFLV
ncbi:hypothetical protein KSS87_010840 [Heliosperma pusillum]|nr:hypothetical protein KSS87_010840 [Heliosperma pusillum]